MAMLNQNLIPSEINELYEFCNERYFDNSLPKSINLEWSPRMHKKLGLAISRSNIYGDLHTIRLAEILRGNKLKALNIMVHECLHIKAYDMYEKTKDDRYLDRPGKFKKYNEDYKKGHGPTFHAWKDELNSKYQELNISATDDEQYDDFELNEREYYVIYLTFNTLGKEIYHSAFYSTSDFRDSEMTGLVDGLKELYGEDNILSAKTFSTGSHNAKSLPSLTLNGLLKKRTKISAFKPEFIESLIKHPTTITDPEVFINKSSEYDHINESVRKITNFSKSMRIYKLMDYSKKVIDTLGKEFKIPELRNPSSVLVMNPTHSDFDKKERDFLLNKWKEMTPDEFIESDKRLVSSVLYSIKLQYDIEKIEKDISYSLEERGLFRFNENEFKDALFNAVIKKGKRNGDDLLPSEFQKIKDLNLNFSQKNIEDCVYAMSSKSDYDFDAFKEYCLMRVFNEGHMDAFDDSIKFIESVYASPTAQDIKNSVTQMKFNMLVKQGFDPNIERDIESLKDILSAYSGRVEQFTFESLLIKNCIKDLSSKISNDEIQSKLILLKDHLVKKESLMSLHS